MVTQDFERSVSALKAIEVAREEIRALGYAYKVKRYGDYMPIYEVNIERGGDRVVSGVGKGGEPFCEAGAYFEAIEHLYGETIIPMPEKLVVKHTHELAKQDVGGKSLPLEMLLEFPDQRVYCTALHEYGGEGRVMYVPTFFWSPSLLMDRRYVCDDANVELYEYMLKYASNSGVASGMTKEDAVLHGINEGIERDGYGTLLYRYFYCDEVRPLPVLDKGSLSKELKYEILDIEHHVKHEVVLIDATTNLGVPVVGAVFKGARYGGGHCTPGFGCSLYPEIAIKRAVYEALQIVYGTQAYADEYQMMHERDLERIDFDDRFAKCMRFDLSVYEKGLGYEMVDYDDLGDRKVKLDKPYSTMEQVARLVGLLEKKGMRVYVHELKALAHGAHVMCTQIPGLSLFFLAAGGMMVPPEGRTVEAY
ncbi:YcaO-like family protein [Planctomycetota bacterium]|nr:YcaO-like family protein [Planctomycetota bacterium]